jgi:6-phosphogluconolactonase
VYGVNELTSTVSSYRFDSAGKLVLRDTVEGLPVNFDGVSHAADIHINRSGTVLYSSNRGHDSIAVFRVRPDGIPEPACHVPTGGKNPRNFALVAEDRYLLAANQDSDNVVVFCLDENGIPIATGVEITVPKPVCVLER